MGTLRRLGLELLLYQRYVDDMDVSGVRVKVGMKYDEEADMLTNDEPDNDEVKDDAQMMELLRKIANNMIKMITWEEDHCNKYDDNKLPVLDVKMFIDKKDKV